MSFKLLDQRTVESTDGYLVTRTARFEAEYQEGSNKITIDVEPANIPGDIIINSNANYNIITDYYRD